MEPFALGACSLLHLSQLAANLDMAAPLTNDVREAHTDPILSRMSM